MLFRSFLNMDISMETNVVKAGPEGEPEKASGHGSTRSNRSNRWFDRITVDPKCEAVDGLDRFKRPARSGSYNTDGHNLGKN